ISNRTGVARRPLSEVASFEYGYTAKAAPAGEYRFLRITDIGPNGKCLPGGAMYVNAGPEADRFLVSPGDVLMARTGATFGKTMLVEGDAPAVFASFLIRVRLDSTVVDERFYWHFAQSREYWDQANALVSRSGQPQFNAN